MILIIVCNYCGHKCEKNVYSYTWVKSMSCDKCGDSSLSAMEESEKMDQYVVISKKKVKNYDY